MKTIIRNSIHVDGRSHDCLIVETKGRKIKITYEAYNAAEKCNVELFDGDKWNHILSMLDMGVAPDSSAYIFNELKRERRANDLFKKAEVIYNNIL